MSFVAAVLALALFAPAPSDDLDPAGADARTHSWDPAIVDMLRTLPVQEDGRVKPFDTQVSFLLLRLNGRRRVPVPDEPRFGAAAGQDLSPVEWALDALVFPEQAAHYPVFQVQNSDVIHALGLPIEGKRKRDRYTYDELRRGEAELMSLTSSYVSIDEKERTVVQGQVVNLGINYSHYRLFQQSFEFARLSFPVAPTLRERFGGRAQVSLSDVLTEGAALAETSAALRRTGADPAALAAVDSLRSRALTAASESRFLAWIPAPGEQEAWLSLADLAQHALVEPHGHDHSDAIAAVAAAEALVTARDDAAAFSRAATDLHGQTVALASARGEYEKVELEVALYQADPFHRSLLLYLLAFVVAALSWLRPKNRWVWRLVSFAMIAATLVLVIGITVRCILRGRPPVTTLYETVLFVTAIVALTSLVVEAIQRRRVALSLGAALCAAGLFLAASYERLDGQDTMPTLIAVLDTNFWLATHVTTVTMGYAASLLAGFLAHIYLLGKLLRLRQDDKPFYTSLARTVYGVVCFALLFSIVGTILGGVWANDSWGRFWGWDPKENGALMIVLWNIVILHTRMAGLVRDWGLCLLAVFGNLVVGFSWWGVNLLGVGLHSYGFTAGVQRALNGFYSVEAGVVLLGGVAWLMHRRSAT